MTVVLDRKITAGGTTCAAIADCSLQAARCGATVIVTGQKRPVAFLFCKDEIRIAISSEGRHLSPSELDAILPGAWQAFDRSAAP